jgi:peptidoglycan/LPS O-acetylase OafA/YrhL
MRDKLDPLTSLRFFAAFGVMMHHYIWFFFPEYATVWFWKILVGEGYCGVTLFFVLSGFVLTYNYSGGFRRLDFREWADFYVARFARIYPVFLLGFLAILYWMPWSGPDAVTWPLALSNLTLTHAFVPDIRYFCSFNPPSWSISVEMLFYAVFPFAIPLLRSMGAFSRWRALVLALVLNGIWFGVAYWKSSDPLFKWYCYMFPVGRLFDFGVGICCGIMFLHRGKAKALARPVATALELGWLALLLVLIVSGPPLPFGIRLGPYYTLPMAAGIYLFASNRGFLSRILCSSPLKVLGEASYAMYLIHWPVMLAVRSVREWRGLTEPTDWTTAVLATSITIFISIPIHYFYERPMRSIIRNRFGFPRPKPVVPAAAPAEMHGAQTASAAA